MYIGECELNKITVNCCILSDQQICLSYKHPDMTIEYSVQYVSTSSMGEMLTLKQYR